MLPEMKTTEPYSPSERAKARAKPVMIAGVIDGRITLTAVWKRFAPRQAEASSTSRSSPSRDRKSTRLNSSHLGISYAVFCLKKKKYIHMNIRELIRLHINTLLTATRHCMQ